MSFSNCKTYQTRKSKKIPVWPLKFSFRDNWDRLLKNNLFFKKLNEKGAQRDNAETEAETWELHHRLKVTQVVN